MQGEEWERLRKYTPQQSKGYIFVRPVYHLSNHFPNIYSRKCQVPPCQHILQVNQMYFCSSSLELSFWFLIPPVRIARELHKYNKVGF